jgi:hypothetical protein
MIKQSWPTFSNRILYIYICLLCKRRVLSKFSVREDKRMREVLIDGGRDGGRGGWNNSSRNMGKLGGMPRIWSGS